MYKNIMTETDIIDAVCYYWAIGATAFTIGLFFYFKLFENDW